jgi:DNA-binding NarL/FixJ family response regulator
VNTSRALLIADDHPLFRSALRGALQALLPGAAIHEADSFAALKSAVRANPDLDLILLDLDMPGVQGFSSLLWLRGEHPALPVAIVSGQSEPAVMRRALDFGASGFIPKATDPATMATAVRTVLDGGVWAPPQIDDVSADRADSERARRIASLSPQQFRVLMMLADGRLNKQIASDIGVTEATVKAHVTAILRKLGLFRRTQAAVLAQRLMLTEASSLKVEGSADESEPLED